MSLYASPKPPTWPWALGFGLLLLGSLVVFVASFAVSAATANMASSREEHAVEQTVLDFDAAYEDEDCEAFRALVNEDLADELVDGDYRCSAWLDIAESLRVDGEYSYSVDVLEVHVAGDGASVDTEETAGDGDPTTYRYTLERSDDGWVITHYDSE